ncbi:MAG: phospholipid carrier-dependent glycosyltransferase [Myxococcota bacterium]
MSTPVSQPSPPPVSPNRWTRRRIRRWGRAAIDWMIEERWLLAVLLAALVVRLHWNLVVHPPGDYVYSDMNGYVSRADRMLKAGLAPHEYSSFFPYGTHWIVAGMKLAFGKDNFPAIGVLYALLGAFTVAFAYAAARRACHFRWVPPAVGLVGIFYYPHLSLGGYILSEVPFAFFLMGAVLFSLRLADEGHRRDAWMMGLMCGLGMVIRPQILVSAAFLGLFWIARRKALPKIRLTHLLQSFVPVLILLAASTALLRHNTGRLGLVSENGTFNLVFGRCHNSKIRSTPDGKGHGRVHFRPPSFLQVRNHEARSKKKGVPPRVALNAALEDELVYAGYIGDGPRHMQYVRECMRRTGWVGQLEYSVLNATLLWRHNVPWPDSGRTQWRSISRWWTRRHRDLLAVPALIGLLTLVLGRRTVRQGLLAVHLLASLLVAAVFFGSIRVRTPYDFIILTLALEVYAFALWRIYRGVQWIRGRMRERRASSV